MNEEILKLAKECGLYDLIHENDEYIIEAFYKAAYNKAIEDVAKVCDVKASELQPYPRITAEDCAAAIRTLEMK